MTRQLIYKPLSMLAIAFMLSSCGKYLDVQPPGSVTQEFVITDQASLEKVLFSSYNYLQGGNLYGGRIQRSAALFADEIDFQLLGQSGANGTFRNRLFSPLTNNQGEGIWTDSYGAIYRANLVIGASESRRYPADEAVYNKFSGEGYFIRALCHLEVCRFFSRPYSDPNRASNPGAVLRLEAETSTSIARNLRLRSTVEQTYNQVLADLEVAISRLPDAAGAGSDQRATKAAAIALKARVLFDMGRFADAAATADALLSLGRYTLDSPWSPFRNSGNQAAGGVIFSLNNRAGDDGAGDLRGNYYSYNLNVGQPQPANVALPLDSNAIGGDYGISLVRALRTGGLLRSDSLLLGKDLNKKITSKWRGANIAGQIPSNVPVLRIAEFVLTRSESRFQLQNEAGAREDLNAIRTYAGSAPVGEDITGQPLLDSIRLERRRELFLENDRFHELRRLQLNTGPNPERQFSYNTDLLFPIPLSEINGNPNIQKNAGN